ncbi:MAG: glycosyltransferase [Candidatus Rokubacteria bacterium]|nr:glycosyltransferase [Candidatus Rokubacteria bacterium]MBI3105446.1 glycosyltransferase [Candidatus Rokubacteria bacterium]
MNTVLHTEASRGLGGQELRTLDEAEATVGRGWRVLLACQPESHLHQHARMRGLQAVAVGMRGAWDLPAVLRLAALIRREDVGIVHTHSSIDGWVAGMAARLARVPVVRTRHVSIPIRRGLNPVYQWLADRVITSGEAVRAVVIAAGVAPDRVIAIPAGVRLEDFEGLQGGEEAARSLGLSRPVIGSVAMFRGSKGHHVLLEAFCLVRGKHPTARLLLVGDGGRRAWVESLAKARGLGDSVLFTGFRRDVPPLLAAMDCFVLASTRTEGVPQSLLQAFAAGTPVVGSAVGGVPELIRDGVTGLLAPPGDAPALARAVEAVLADPGAAAARARAGRALVGERFSRDTSISRLLGLYEEVLA